MGRRAARDGGTMGLQNFLMGRHDMTRKKIEHTDEEWRERLSPEAYHVLRNKGTERPGTGRYYKHDADGTYLCGGCGTALFESAAKFDSGSGWPSFWKAADGDAVAEIHDTTHGMVRTEVVCSACGGHLGHVFPDGYGTPTGQRFCINSLSLDFRPKAD